MPEVRLIDANELIDKRCSTCCLRKTCANRYENDGKQYVCGDIKNIVNAQTIEAEPVRHGRWVFGAKAEYIGSCIPTGISLFCSCCGKDAVYSAENTQELSDYCPNCGAKMQTEPPEEVQE